MPVTVADCQRNQSAWNSAVAGRGGEVWEDGGLHWSWHAHDGQLMLNFPLRIDVAEARRGVEAARARGARIIGAWLAPDVDASALEAVGFERGWEPWWMAAQLSEIAPSDDERVALCSKVPEYGEAGRQLLALATVRPAAPGMPSPAWMALLQGAHGRLPRRDTAGIYDMEVWPRFRRKGRARALLRTVCGAARAAGARSAVLNASPDGERVYLAEGFAHIGKGITYWHHGWCCSSVAGLAA